MCNILVTYGGWVPEILKRPNKHPCEKSGDWHWASAMRMFLSSSMTTDACVMHDAHCVMHHAWHIMPRAWWSSLRKDVRPNKQYSCYIRNRCVRNGQSCRTFMEIIPDHWQQFEPLLPWPTTPIDHDISCTLHGHHRSSVNTWNRKSSKRHMRRTKTMKIHWHS